MTASRIGLRLLASLLVVTTAACEHETAPKIRDAIESAQQRALGGNLGALSPPIGLALDQVSRRFWISSIFPRDTIVVQRGEDRYLMLATVLERVYVPPRETGARPYVRRTILLWQESTEIGFVVMSDDSSATVAADYFSVSPIHRLMAHTGAVLEAQNHRSWFGRDGTIEIMNGVRAGTCPFAGDTAAREAIVNGQEDVQAPDAACERTMYPVSIRATLEAGDPNHRSVLEAVANNGASLFIDAQIPGLRFVTKCRAVYPRNQRPPEGCANPFAFWRDDSQFARELDFQWSQFRESSVGLYVREIAAGTANSYPQDLLHSPGPVRYRILAADGHTMSSGVAPDVDWRGPMAILAALGPFQPGYHGMLIAPARALDSTADRYAAALLDFEFLQPGVQRP